MEILNVQIFKIYLLISVCVIFSSLVVIFFAFCAAACLPFLILTYKCLLGIIVLCLNLPSDAGILVSSKECWYGLHIHIILPKFASYPDEKMGWSNIVLFSGYSILGVSNQSRISSSIIKIDTVTCYLKTVLISFI